MTSRNPARHQPILLVMGSPCAALRAALMAPLLLIACAVLGISPATAEGAGESLWRGLRDNFPFHLQTVGLSEPNRQGERTLIIAEPPPTLPRVSFRDGLQSIFGESLLEAHLMRHPIGYDGWVEDIVATLRYPIGDGGKKRLREDLSLLAERLYGTAYKFAPIRLPATRRTAPLAPPSLAVSAAELKVWLLDSDAPLTSVDIGTQHRLKDLLTGGRPGVYLSPQRGLVVIILPRDFPINAYRGEIRKFALDSDAIMGAMATGDRRLAIIGREPDTALDAVPPLRVESVLALAATKEKELGQSYERNDAFAGKLLDGSDVGKDWAPIYLSRDLVNTEIGSLLNITDQMLKSWSEGGKVEYVHFPYPKPTLFPFAGGLLHDLGANEVTYNWNTVGVGSVFAFPEARIFALTRTGSLPVSYFPEGSDKRSRTVQKAMSAEDQGYDYFSARRDPYLGRVVQYSAVYQVFRAFPVQAEREDAPPTNYRAATEFALATTRTALQAIAKREAVPDPAFLRNLIEEMAREEGKRLSEDQKQLILTNIRAHPEKFCVEPAAAFSKLQEETGQDITNRVATRLADRGSLSSQGRFDRLSQKANAAPDEDMREFIKGLTPKYREVAIDRVLLEDNAAKMVEELRHCLEEVADLDSVKKSYVAAATPIESGYIKTASIVLSSFPGGVGGHNLYSHVTRVELSPTTPKGQVVIDAGPNGERVLRINPDDAPHSNELARAFERHADEPNAARFVEAELARGGMVRDMKVGLQLNSISPAEGRGLTRALEGDTIGEPGFRSLPDDVDVVRVAQQAEARGLDLMVAREGDGFLVFRLQPKPVHAVRAPTEPGMVEMINTFSEETAAGRLPSGLPPLRFGAGNGIAQDELLGIIKTQQLRTAASGGGGRGRPPQIRTLTGDSEGPRGWFFDFEGDGDTTISYGRRGESDDLTVLRAVAKGSIKAREALGKSVDWSRAEIKHLGTSTVGSEVQLSYEISIPIRKTSWWQLHEGSLVVRVIGYFKRLLNADEVRDIEATLRDVVEKNASQNSIAADGVADLKAEILRKVKPERLEFHLNSGAGDLIVVERQSEASGDLPS
jgi:hypothetical protein